jgi:hypothetical protein
VANPAAVIAISGTARLTSLRGSGVVELEDTELDQLVFDGSLRAKMVSIKNLALTGKLTCTHLIADSVQAEQIEVHPPPQSARAKRQRKPLGPAVEIRDALTARCLIATGEVKGIGPTPAELHLTQSLTATSLTNVHVAATGTKGSEGGSATRLAVDVERAGTACQFTGPIGDIAFRTVKESLTVDAANSVAITGDCTGQLQVQAGSLRLGSVQGCGTLSAEEIVVTEDVAGQDDGLIITAGSTLRVGGTARNAALLCDASGDQPVVTVGYASGHPTRLGDPELSPENVQPALPAPDRAASSLPDGQVDSCVVVVGGGVAISRSVSSSLLRVDGQLQVEGDLDCSAPAIANLDSREAGVSPPSVLRAGAE